MKSSARKVELASASDLFSTEQERQDAKLERVQQISLAELYPFPDHPFSVRDDDSMKETVESIKESGVLQPAIARPREGGGYELVSGHRRKRACELAGLDTMPVIVRDLDRDTAIIFMVDSNIQRENISPMEKAKALKMKMEAIRRQGMRTDLTSPNNSAKFRSDDEVGAEMGMSGDTVRNIISLTQLVPELQQMVDDKKIAVTPAYQIAALKPEEQALLVETIASEQATPSVSQAQRMKQLSQSGKLNEDTLTAEADDLIAGQYKITEESAPEGYVAQTESQTVTVLPNSSIGNTFTFYNSTTTTEGDGTIRKVDADNPTVGIPGAVIRITSVKLDDGGSFVSEYVTKDGGYILKEDLDFSELPTGSYVAEEITPPEGFILSSDVSKVKRPFVWDGEHDISLIFENSAKVKVMLKKVDESGSPLAGAIFVILRDGQVIGTEETKEDGTITVSNVTEGYYEFREVSAPAGFDCDRSPVGAHVNAEDLQGEQTIVVEKMNHHKRSLTITKRNTETGEPVPNTSFHIRGVNLG